MEKRYQVFVSSTYSDLLEERQEVMQALLELDCIPAGMELFPAADDDQWSLIKKVIDESDYYILIVGGRYGSIGKEGKSYTQMEYEYALSKNKPIIAFLHKAPENLPAKKTESAPENKEKLNQFCNLAKQKMCRFWETPKELGSLVSRSLMKLIKSHPSTGWIKADQATSADAASEILSLKKQIETLQRELAASQTQAPPGTEKLSQGEDPVTIHYLYSATHHTTKAKDTYKDSVELTWNEIFSWVSPAMINEAPEWAFRTSLTNLVIEKETERLRKSPAMKGYSLNTLEVADPDFQTVKVQLKALGLITQNTTRHRSVKDKETYWTLTLYGDMVMTRLRAIPSNGE